MRNPFATLVAAVVLLYWAAGDGFAAEKADPVATDAVAGGYRTAWLQLEGGGVRLDGKKTEPLDVPLFLGFRDGRAAVAWFAHPAMSGPRVVWLDAATLSFEGAVLQGSLTGRTNLHWGDRNVYDFTYEVDAAADGDGRVEGSFTAHFVDDAGEKFALSGKLRGEIVSPQDASTMNALPEGANWPHYYGNGYALSGPDSGAKLIDDLTRSRPVWKSEAYIPTGYGSAPDNRYPDRAGRSGNGGGSSSPVVADGRMYQFYYYPRGPVGQSQAYIKNFIGRPFTGEADLLAKARELYPKREVQQQAVLNHFRTQADEILVCLDAATGQTLWKTTFPQRGNNYQTHKHRGHFPVPLVAGGVVYQPGTTGRLYAVDAASGDLLWEYPDAQPAPHITTRGGIDCHAPSPVLIDGIVAFAASGGVTGVDAKTGQKQWEQRLWHRSSLLPWQRGGAKLILATDRDHQKKQNYAVALDPANGEILWRAPVDYLIDYTFPLLAEDLLIGYSLQKENLKPGENDGLAIVHAYRLSPGGLEPAWTTEPLAPIIDTVGMAVDGDHVYVSAAREALWLSLIDGEVAARVENVGGARTQTAFVASERFFIQPEGRHGGQSFLMLAADPAGLRPFSASQGEDELSHRVGAEFQWRPPHTWTTAYANQPIVYPLVDGRLFVRGLDALYCYDLRGPSDRK